jgi:hypothetical protein
MGYAYPGFALTRRKSPLPKCATLDLSNGNGRTKLALIKCWIGSNSRVGQLFCARAIERPHPDHDRNAVRAGIGSVCG